MLVLCAGSGFAAGPPPPAPVPVAPPSAADAKKQLQTVELKIGMVPFDKPRGPGKTDAEKSLEGYFEAVQKAADIDLRVTLVKGNYYQIHQWMREGMLDGAVVSSFTAYLLTSNENLSMLPVLEFERAHTSSPQVWATKKGEPVSHPRHELDLCLEQVRKMVDGPVEGTPCEFRLVSHLSTTGFVAPLTYIEESFVRKNVPRTQQPDFWTRLLQKSRLELWHDASDPAACEDKEKTVIHFTYADGPTREPLLTDLPTLNDVLLVGCKRSRPARPSLASADRWTVPEEQCMSGSRLLTALAAPAAMQWWRNAGAVLSSATPGGYVRATFWSEPARKTFADRMEQVFALPKVAISKKKETKESEAAALAVLYDRWYGRGDYAFSIDEVIDVLRFDQIIRQAPRAALVLPGGGVRATYQSVILDDLYKRRIINEGQYHAPNDAACVAAGPQEGNSERLVINGIAGTSGGALLGYMASRRNTRDTEELRKQWIDESGVKTTPLAIFPSMGVFRWLSLLFLVTVFASTSAVHLPQRGAPVKEVPFWYTTFLSIVVIVAPFLIWRNASNDPTYYPRCEGVAFFLVIAVIHFIHSSSVSGARRRSTKWLWAGVGAMVGGAGAAGVLIGTQHFFQSAAAAPESSAWISAGWTLASTLALIFFVTGLSFIAAFNGTRIDPERAHLYRAKALPVLLLLLGLSIVVFSIGLMTQHVTFLEMTLDYWLWVFLGALFGAKLIITAARLYRQQLPLLGGIRFLNSPSGTVPFPYTPAVTLVVWGALGITVWLVFIAPALYTSHNGEDAFRRAIREGPKDELVPLIVSMTGLGNDVPGYKSPAYRGDYYAVNERWCGIEDPDAATSAKLFRLNETRFQKAVFASGSPFPIYPATRVEAEVAAGEQPGLFVDGGYAHRVPIEATGLVRAAQILVVENVSRQDAPAPTKGFRAGALTANLGNTFSFLFDRSQTVDVQRRHSAVVATIYPDWSPPDPFLMDFRESVVTNLWNEAKGDLQGHRVARVESWGEPILTGGAR